MHQIVPARYAQKPSRLSLGVFTATFLVASFAFLAATARAEAQAQTDCGGAQVRVEREGVVPFELPRDEFETFQIEPQDDLTVRVLNAPPSGRIELSVLLPLGKRIHSPPMSWSGQPAGEEHDFELSAEQYTKLAERYVRHLRGLYSVEATLYPDDSDDSDARPICVVPFKLRVGGFGGIAPPVAAGAAAAAGAASVVAGVWAVSGSYTKLDLKLAVRRRRGRNVGWTRWIPAPAWRRTIVATVLGALTGALTTLALQQAGLLTLSNGSGFGSIALGGGVTISVGLVWGSVIDLFRSRGGLD